MKKKYIFLFTILCIFLIPINTSAQSGHNGYGVLGTGSNVSGKKGLLHNESGVRLTMVDSNGKMISGTHSADYWSGSAPSNAEMLSGSSYKTKHINSSGSDLTTGLKSYSANIYAESHIGSASSGSWSNRDNVLYETMMRAVDKTEGKKCVTTEFFKDMNFNLCDKLKEQCDDLKKYYILIEPLLYINVNGHDIVVTGTEYAALIDKLYPANDSLIYDLRGPDGYGNAILGMYLTNRDKADSLDYELKSRGKLYSIPSDVSRKNYSSYSSSIQKGTYKSPMGYAMQLVWLGELADDCEETPKDCCVPCDLGDEACTQMYGDNYDPNDPACCETDKDIATDFKGVEITACTPFDEYWKRNEDKKPQYCTGGGTCTPSPSNPKQCCNSPGWCDLNDENKAYCEEYCKDDEEPPLQSCPKYDVEPGAFLGVCTEDNSKTHSYFWDPVFNEGGQFSAYNQYELLTGASINSLLATFEDESKLQKNSFLAIARIDRSKGNEYLIDEREYCSIYCQELLDVELPINYPVVDAGRYFRWHIEGDDAIIAKSSDAKLCAVDIDLDKAIDTYLDMSDDARRAAGNELTFTYKRNSEKERESGVGTPGAPYSNCAAYKSDYTSLKIEQPISGETSIDKDGKTQYVYTYYTQFSEVGKCCLYTNPSTGDCEFEGKKFLPEKTLTPVEASEKVYLGDTGIDNGVFASDSLCLFDERAAIGITDYHNMSERPSNQVGSGTTDGTTKLSPKDWCENTYSDYVQYIQNFEKNVKNLYNSIMACHYSGNILLDMGVELSYQTLFDTHTYSTDDEDENSKIIEANSDENDVDKTAGQTCIYKEVNCEDDLNSDGYIDTPFFMDQKTRKYNNEDEAALNCKDVAMWSSQEKVESNVPSVNDGVAYNPKDVIMKTITDYSTISNKYTYESDVSFGSNWSTVYLSLVSTEKMYKLNETINACICKDGYVENLKNGECSCEREVSYKNFTSTYKNYRKLSDGTLIVEFMNGSGLYPINLKYWKLGSVTNEVGHFDSLASELGLCDMTAKGAECVYGDPNGVCRYVVKNRIIASPDDNVTCDDGDCSIVECDDTGEPCEPSPTVDCPGGNCFDCPDGDCSIVECIVDGETNDDCKDLTGLSIIYRQVDLDDPFPNGREPGFNWQGKTDLISNNRGVSGTQLYSDSSVEPLYSFELTPASIKKIRRDSASLDLMTKYTTGTVIYPNGRSTGGYSLFVHESLTEYASSSEINISSDQRFTNIVNNSRR